MGNKRGHGSQLLTLRTPTRPLQNGTPPVLIRPRGRSTDDPRRCAAMTTKRSAPRTSVTHHLPLPPTSVHHLLTHHLLALPSTNARPTKCTRRRQTPASAQPQPRPSPDVLPESRRRRAPTSRRAPTAIPTATQNASPHAQHETVST